MAATLNTPPHPDLPSRPGLLSVEPDLLLARDLTHAVLVLLEQLLPQTGGPIQNIAFDYKDIAALHRAAGMAADAAARAAEALYDALDSDRAHAT